MDKAIFRKIENTLQVLLDKTQKQLSFKECSEDIWMDIFSLLKLTPKHQKIICQNLGECFSFMPGGTDSLELLPSDILKTNFSNDKVTIYGGTFNPWHRGHLECLLQCPEEDILVVPDYNPWKQQSDDPNIYNFYLSLIDQLRETPYSIYSGFLGLESSNPTVDWIESVKLSEKNLLIGDDNFLSFDKWKDVEKLCKILTKLYVVPRLSNLQEIEDKKVEIQKLNLDLEIIILQNHHYQDLSSTKLRQKS